MLVKGATAVNNETQDTSDLHAAGTYSRGQRRDPDNYRFNTRRLVSDIDDYKLNRLW